MKPNYERLAKIAAEQDGVVTRKQLKALHLTDKDVGRMVRRRLWLQLQRGVYLLAPGPATWRQLARAAQWAGGKTLALDAGSALLWRGFEGPEEGAIELVITSKNGGACPRGAVVRRPTREVAVSLRDAVRVASIEDALLSFAALSKDREAIEVAVESALASHKTTERKIWLLIGKCSRPGVRGVALLRSVMEGRPEGKPARSFLEIELFRLIRRSGLPLPSRNVDVIDGNGDPREIDLCYVPEKGAIEADSRRWHGTATQKAADRLRQNALEAVGYRFVRVTWSDVFDRPQWVVDQIRQLLGVVVAA
jgi:hypothetical protein